MTCTHHMTLGTHQEYVHHCKHLLVLRPALDKQGFQEFLRTVLGLVIDRKHDQRNKLHKALLPQKPSRAPQGTSFNLSNAT
eukprot:m.1056808 g.1056808  ORF g.1056808 m.1056808 type:complete len:81 (-) comp24200_c0_seq2:235-477(-)